MSSAAKLPRVKKVRKPKKKTVAQLTKDLWSVFSPWIRARDGNICFTCGVTAYGSSYHAGHFLMKKNSGLVLYFHEDNVHGQCILCNKFREGEQYKHGIKIGAQKVAELYSLIGQSPKDYPFAEKIAYYSGTLQTTKTT